MFLSAIWGIASLLPLCQPAAALPKEQQPLNSHDRNNVQTVRAELIKAEIIPTVIDDFLPSLTLSVSWSKKVAKLGNTVKPKRLQHQPEINLNDITDAAHPDTSEMSYVVTLTDPDAPSRDNPEWSEMCHWIATNVSISHKTVIALPLPAYDFTEKTRPKFGGLDDIMTYKPPGPPKKTGKHRYVFLVFAPKNGTTKELHLSKPKARQHWGTGSERGGVRSWAFENGLVPVAANFIYSQHKKQ